MPVNWMFYVCSFSNNIFCQGPQSKILEHKEGVSELFSNETIKWSVASLLVCSSSKLSAAASVHLVREPVRSTAANDGSEVSGGPRGGCRIALPGSHLLVCSVQQGTSVKPARAPSPRRLSSCVGPSQLSRENSNSRMKISWKPQLGWNHIIIFNITKITSICYRK